MQESKLQKYKRTEPLRCVRCRLPDVSYRGASDFIRRVKSQQMRLNTELVRLSRARKILHILSGHSAGGTLRQSGVPGDKILVWLDDLTAGPTPRSGSLEEMSRIRERYWNQPPPWPIGRVRKPHSLEERDRVIRDCSKRHEIVLWFGPSVIEQFSLLQVLATLAEQEFSPTRVSLVSCPKYGMGVYRSEQLATFFESRVTLEPVDLEFAKGAWELYCKPDPLPLFRFANNNANSRPAACNAILQQLTQYPSVHNGMSASERALLSAVDEAKTVAHAVGTVLANDDAQLTGDCELYKYMWAFIAADVPLIEAPGFVGQVRSGVEFRRLPVELTSAGREVLNGHLDQVSTNGVDRWIGGVHLMGKQVPWRWDTDRHLLVQCSGTQPLSR